MSAPTPLSAADLHVLACSVLERVELVALTAELGGAPGERTIASVMASALELHRELARTMDERPGSDDGDLIARISRTMERLNDALATIATLVEGGPRGTSGGLAAPRAEDRRASRSADDPGPPRSPSGSRRTASMPAAR